VRQTSGLNGTQLLEAADTAHALAEQEFDRSPETRAELEHTYLGAAQALDYEGHPNRASAWLGLATVRRYQKGRRDDTLAAYDAALTAAPDSIEVWNAYLDYITYAVSLDALLTIVERMPAQVRVQQLPGIMAVGQGTDRWGTMPSQDQRRFAEALPKLLQKLDDRPSLGTLLSTTALDEYRNGSHSDAHELMLRAVATGHPGPACVDRLTINLVKRGEKARAAAILRDSLTRPVPSDSMRLRMTKRLTRCDASRSAVANIDAAGDAAATELDVAAEPDVLAVFEPVSSVRHLRPGENAVVDPRPWRA
jgi:tetratricopeptide (TPR) repeat protein